MYAAIRQGKATKMNRMPCWLEWDDELGKPVLNEAKAAIVRQLFELACAGQGILAIVRQMLSQKVPPVTVPWM